MTQQETTLYFLCGYLLGVYEKEQIWRLLTDEQRLQIKRAKAIIFNPPVVLNEMG